MPSKCLLLIRQPKAPVLVLGPRTGVEESVGLFAFSSVAGCDLI